MERSQLLIRSGAENKPARHHGLSHRDNSRNQAGPLSLYGTDRISIVTFCRNALKRNVAFTLVNAFLA